MGRAVN